MKSKILIIVLLFTPLFLLDTLSEEESRSELSLSKLIPSLNNIEKLTKEEFESSILEDINIFLSIDSLKDLAEIIDNEDLNSPLMEEYFAKSPLILENNIITDLDLSKYLNGKQNPIERIDPDFLTQNSNNPTEKISNSEVEFSYSEPYRGKLSYYLKEIRLKDGDQLYSNSIINSSGIVETMQPIDSIRMIVNYNYPLNQRPIILSLENPISCFGNDTIKLVQIDKNEVIIAANDYTWNNLIGIQGITSTGRFINSSSPKKQLSAEEDSIINHLYTELIDQLYLIKNKIEDNKYKTKEDLTNDFSHFETRINDQLDSTKDIQTSKYTSIRYKYPIKVESIILYVGDFTDLNFEISMSIESDILEYNLIRISQREEQCIVSNDGDLIISPEFIPATLRQIGSYFYVDNNDLSPFLYILDPLEKRIIKTKYKTNIFNCSELNEDLIKIAATNSSSDINDAFETKYGVINKRGELIIPYTYNDVEIEENKELIKCVKFGNKKNKAQYTFFDLNGKLIK